MFSTKLSTVSPDDYLLIWGDLNDHATKAPEGFNEVHGRRGFASSNADGIRILNSCAASNLAITNIYFMKPDSHLITSQSSNSCDQFDYTLTRRSNLNLVQNVKVIGDEKCVTWYKLLFCQINLGTPIRKQHKPPPKRCTWKLRKPKFQEKHKKAVEESINSSTLLSDPDSEEDVESIWTKIKSCLISASNSASD